MIGNQRSGKALQLVFATTQQPLVIRNTLPEFIDICRALAAGKSSFFIASTSAECCVTMLVSPLVYEVSDVSPAILPFAEASPRRVRFGPRFIRTFRIADNTFRRRADICVICVIHVGNVKDKAETMHVPYAKKCQKETDKLRKIALATAT